MVIELKSRNQGRTFLGLSTDTKLDNETVTPNSLFTETDTGAIYCYNGGWRWIGANKDLGHNRTMLSLELSYKTGHRNSVVALEHAVYRFNPGPVKFHHVEDRIMRIYGGNVRFQIFVGHNIANLPPIVTTLRKHNQAGLALAKENSLLTYDFHGNVTDAQLVTILAGATEVDTDYLFAEVGLGNQPGSPAASALPSGRHYDPNIEYLVVIDPDDTDEVEDINYFYAYLWHEKATEL